VNIDNDEDLAPEKMKELKVGLKSRNAAMANLTKKRLSRQFVNQRRG
jgi:hypothetical protein